MKQLLLSPAGASFLALPAHIKTRVNEYPILNPLGQRLSDYSLPAHGNDVSFKIRLDNFALGAYLVSVRGGEVKATTTIIKQ